MTRGGREREMTRGGREREMTPGGGGTTAMTAGIHHEGSEANPCRSNGMDTPVFCSAAACAC